MIEFEKIYRWVIVIFSLYGILVSLPGVVIAITIHEWIKCLTAHRLGDATLKGQGRLAPNPLKHIDPLGAIFMLIFGYGWANPARVSAFRLRSGKKDMIVVFLMPFLANIILGAIFILAAQFFILNFFDVLVTDDAVAYAALAVLRRAAVLNIGFALFNLIPLYPLDGINLVAAFNPILAAKINQREKILQIVLAFGIILGLATIVFEPITRAIVGVMLF